MSFIANGWSSHEKYWTITSLMRIVTLIYVKLISQNMQTQLTFLLEDSLANHSHLPGKEKARMMNATCGAKCYEQFKKLNRDSSSLKMSLVSRILMADWYSSRCALTWKLKGTKYNRLLFLLVPKTLRTVETGVGSLELGMLPTITASFGERGGNLNPESNHDTEKAMRVAIPKLIALLPTPSASDTEGSPKRKDQISQGGNGNWRRTSDNTGIMFGAKLMDVAPIIAGSNGKNSHLNPRFVAEMMGYPVNWTELPFQNGEKNQSKDMETP